MGRISLSKKELGEGESKILDVVPLYTVEFLS